MRVDICESQAHETVAALLNALAAIGAQYDAGESLDPMDGSLGVGLHRFRLGSRVLTVFVDAWGVDLEGPDDLANQVLDQLRR
jgi:hypothetical protein